MKIESGKWKIVSFFLFSLPRGRVSEGQERVFAIRCVEDLMRRCICCLLKEEKKTGGQAIY